MELDPSIVRESLAHSQILDHCPSDVRVRKKPPTHASSASGSSSNNCNKGDNDDDQLILDSDVIYTIYGYQFSWNRFILYHTLAWVPFCGLLHLIAFWLPQIRCLKYKKAPLAHCDFILCEYNAFFVNSKIKFH